MLKITNLKSGYNSMEVLKGLNFEVGENEIVAIIGPNGAGKSTLLKSIFNLCEIYSGKILFRDKNITKLPTHKLIYKGISYVPQGRQVFNNLTVRENLEMGGFIFSARGGSVLGGKDKKLIEKNIKNVFDKFEFLKNKQNDYAFTLSGGQQQILAIARALMQSPKLLLLDEPSLGLSPKIIKEIFNKITDINSEGVAIIIVEQNAKQAVDIADKTYVLENGRVATIGGKEILNNKKIKDIYFGGM